MNKIIVDDYSMATCYIETFCNDIPLTQATGFLYDFNSRPFLISNWHVFSGRNPETGMPMNSNGLVPNTIFASFLDQSTGQYQRYKFNISQNHQNSWIQHPKGQEIDVAAQEINIPIISSCVFINKLASTPEMALNISDDVFVIGYPLGLTVSAYLPVWKRASIASDPSVSVKEKPLILVDTATRSGMSGSPVIIRKYDSFSNVDGGATLSTGPHSKFIGIYSGRLGKGELEAQLGLVWKAEVIEEILKNNVTGDFKLIK